MQVGLAVSLLMHTLLLAWAFLTIQSTPELRPPEPEPISVAIITPSELLRMKQGSETSKELEAKAKEEPQPEVSKKEAEKPKPVTAPELPAEPPPPPEPQKAEPPPPAPDPIAEKLAALPPEPPPPAPGPTPEELKQVEEAKAAAEAERVKAAEERKKAEEKKKAEDKKKAEEKKKAEDKKKAEEKKKLEEAKKKTAADRLSALLDKDPTKKGAPQSAETPSKPTDYQGPTAGTKEGRDSVLTAREEDILKGQISSQLRGCWKLPGGGGGIETMVVTVKWRLRPDGSLDGEPQLDQPQSGPVYQIAAEAAVRAVKSCSPFTLPPDKYNWWKTITWDFDPREMM